MALFWDYDEKELKKTKSGRLMILERLINYGPTKRGEKIKLSAVRKHWKKINISPLRKSLLKLLIWGK